MSTAVEDQQQQQQQQQRPGAVGEEEPLLGERGDAQQQNGKPLYYNFVLGTGVVAQAGAWIVSFFLLRDLLELALLVSLA